MTSVEFMYIAISCAVIVCTMFIIVVCTYLLFQMYRRHVRERHMEKRINSSTEDEIVSNSLLNRANSISKMTFAPNKRK